MFCNNDTKYRNVNVNLVDVHALCLHFCNHQRQSYEIATNTVNLSYPDYARKFWIYDLYQTY